MTVPFKDVCFNNNMGRGCKEVESTTKIAYIIGAYRSDTGNGLHINIETARKVAVKYWEAGYTVICPHLNSANMSGIIPEREFLRRYLELIHLVDTVVILPGFENSVGSHMEVLEASKLGKELIYEEVG